MNWSARIGRRGDFDTSLEIDGDTNMVHKHSKPAGIQPVTLISELRPRLSSTTS